ncbi:MAG: hypothetical protein ACP5T6_03100 [Candidatus Micrarchaeia archaeon]
MKMDSNKRNNNQERKSNINSIIDSLTNKALLNTINSNNHDECSYCGAENIASGNAYICSECGALNNSISKNLINSDPTLSKTISEIYNLKKSGRFDEVIVKYDTLSNNNDVRFAYSAARLCRYASDKMLEQINYNRKDFMEENAEFRAKASIYESKAKRFFYKAIYAVQNAQNPTQEMLFTKAMAELELNALKDSKKTISKLDNIYAYFVNMVLSLKLNNYNDAIEYAYKLVSNKTFREYALYFTALSLIGLKKKKKASIILKTLAKLNLEPFNEHLLDLL